MHREHLLTIGHISSLRGYIIYSNRNNTYSLSSSRSSTCNSKPTYCLLKNYKSITKEFLNTIVANSRYEVYDIERESEDLTLLEILEAMCSPWTLDTVMHPLKFITRLWLYSLTSILDIELKKSKDVIGTIRVRTDQYKVYNLDVKLYNKKIKITLEGEEYEFEPELVLSMITALDIKTTQYVVNVMLGTNQYKVLS